MEKHFDKPWSWDWFSENPNLTIAFIQRHHDKPWNWQRLSKNPFTREIQRQHMWELIRTLQNRDPFYHNPWMLRHILENFCQKC